MVRCHLRHDKGGSMTLLIIAAMLWLIIHFGIAGTRLRGALVAGIGEQAFRGLFSLLSIVALALLIVAWWATWTTPLWFAPGWLRWLLAVMMLVAFVLLATSLFQRNPGETQQAPRGIHRVTRHPMLSSFALWAAVHIVGAGDTAALVFFGTFLLTAVAGMPSIDAKQARRDPAAWQALSAVTSIVPFVAVAQGRNRF